MSNEYYMTDEDIRIMKKSMKRVKRMKIFKELEEVKKLEKFKDKEAKVA